MKNCIIFSLFCILLSFSSVFAKQPCEGIEIVYPKTDTIIDKAEDQSTYLILGNTLDNSDSILTKVEVLNINEQGGSEQSKQVWTGNDKLLKVSAIQQDLNKLDLPNTFWFRVYTQQNGHVCQLESDRFKIK